MGLLDLYLAEGPKEVNIKSSARCEMSFIPICSEHLAQKFLSVTS